MRLGPGGSGGRDKHQGMRRLFEDRPVGLAERRAADVEDANLQRTMELAPDQLHEARRDRLGRLLLVRPILQDEGVNSRPGERIAAQISFERIIHQFVDGIGLTHRFSAIG